MTLATSTSTRPSTSARPLARLGETIAAHGFAGLDAELAALAARARRARVAEAAAGVLTDADAPAVVRERAFAVVCRELSRALRFEPTGPVALTAA